MSAAVTREDLVERLAAHRTIGSAPREELEWLVAHGTLRRFAAGDVVARPGEPLHALYVVLTGALSIRVDHGGGPRKVMEWSAGDVSGLLPYSRMRAAPGLTRIEEAAEMLFVDRDHFDEMTSRCHELTAILVHVMVDRARRFRTSELQTEKMVSLGRLSAGLAHELSNPASALARSAHELSARVAEMERTAITLGAMRLSAEQLEAIAQVRAECDRPGARAALTPLERADREEQAAAWLDRQGVRGLTADELGETALPLETLERLGRALGNEALEPALHALCAGHRVHVLASEIEIAAGRVHHLVAAIKGFTYMDQSQIPKPVAIGQGLRDTMAVLGAKARDKSVAVTIQVAPDLPEVDGFGGELNQVWANLIDNAIDAAPTPGRVEVSAAGEDDSVVVRVVDDGPGVPEELVERIFDPFFTTKPMGSGTGLGLDIARRLVREHDGQIEVDSHPGRTEFRVTLPRTSRGAA